MRTYQYRNHHIRTFKNFNPMDEPLTKFETKIFVGSIDPPRIHRIPLIFLWSNPYSHFPLLGLSFSFLFILPLRVVPAIVVVVQANQWFSPSSPLLFFYPLVPSFFLFIPHGKSLYIVVFVKGKSPRAFTYNASSCYGWSSKNPL